MPITEKRREYLRNYQRKWVAARRADWFKDKVCANCGASDNLDLDHIDPTTKVDSHIWSWSKVRREEELAKCQPLCHDCHKKKTNKDNNFGLKHGTPNGYTRYNCRCRPCTDAEVQRVNEYRWRTGKRKRRIKLADTLTVKEFAVNE